MEKREVSNEKKTDDENDRIIDEMSMQEARGKHVALPDAQSGTMMTNRCFSVFFLFAFGSCHLAPESARLHGCV
ncbi:hypothetical protein BST61_g1943 [Cercospora zeina]